MAIHVGETLNIMGFGMLIAYMWYVTHHSSCHHTKAQAEAPKAERPNNHGAKCEDPKHDELQIQDYKTEERVALLVEKALQPVVQWYGAQKREDKAKSRSMKINQNAIMHRQKMFERVTENKLARIKAMQLAQAEETARIAAKKELTYQHQRETEELRRQLQNQQKKHQREEARTRGLNNAMSKVLGDVERLRARVQEESERRMEVEDKAKAAAADVACLISVVEHTRASVEDEKRQREQVERDLTVEKESTGRVNATVAKLKMSIKAIKRARQKRTDRPVRAINDLISRHAVATFRLHTAESKKSILPKPISSDQAFSDASSLEKAIDRLSAFSITNNEAKPVSQQLVVSHPFIKAQQSIIPQQLVIDQPPTEIQQLVLHQPDVEKDSVVRQATVIDHEPLVNQMSAGQDGPSSDQQAIVDQPLLREPVDEEDPDGGLDIVMKEAPEVEQDPNYCPALFPLTEPAVIQQHLIEEEPVGEDISFVLQQTGQDSDVSMSQGNDPMQDPTQETLEETVQEETLYKFGIVLIPHVPKSERDGSQQTHHGAMPVANMGTAGDSSVTLGKIPPSGPHETSRDPLAIVTQQVDEQAENENTSPLQPEPTAPSGSAIGPTSGVHWAANPDASGPKQMVVFGARHVLPKPKGKTHKFSRDQIDNMKSKASEAPPARPNTHFSSEYLAQLRARMADISVMRKLMGDHIDEDDDWVVQVRQKDQEYGEAVLCNMSEETQYAVPPYTKHMIEQMMESFFLACVWDPLDDEYDFEPQEQEHLREIFMESVKKHMDTHPADTLPVS